MATIVITCDGNDITDDVVHGSATFQATAMGLPGYGNFRVKDLRGGPYTPGYFKVMQEVRVQVDGTYVWGGYIQKVGREYAFEVVDTTVPPERERFWVIDVADYNLLFTKRYVFDQADPVRRIPDYPKGMWDDDVIADLVQKYLYVEDLIADGFDLSSGVTRVGVPGYYEAAKVAAIGQSWGEAMKQLSTNLGSVFHIDADKVLRYVDDETVSAPWGLSDRPTGGQRGYRELDLRLSATEMGNDALVWGAGMGSPELAFSRYEDAASIATHGRLQWSVFRTDVYRQATVDRIARTYVEGSPQHRRGHKDDQDAITVVLFEPGLQPAMVVDFESEIFEYSDTVPVRSMTITFPTTTLARFEVTLSHEIDLPYYMLDPWPEDDGPPSSSVWFGESWPVGQGEGCVRSAPTIVGERWGTLPAGVTHAVPVPTGSDVAGRLLVVYLSGIREAWSSWDPAWHSGWNRTGWRGMHPDQPPASDFLPWSYGEQTWAFVVLWRLLDGTEGFSGGADLFMTDLAYDPDIPPLEYTAYHYAHGLDHPLDYYTILLDNVDQSSPVTLTGPWSNQAISSFPDPPSENFYDGGIYIGAGSVGASDSLALAFYGVDGSAYDFFDLEDGGTRSPDFLDAEMSSVAGSPHPISLAAPGWTIRAERKQADGAWNATAVLSLVVPGGSTVYYPELYSHYPVEANFIWPTPTFGLGFIVNGTNECITGANETITSSTYYNVGPEGYTGPFSDADATPAMVHSYVAGNTPAGETACGPGEGAWGPDIDEKETWHLVDLDLAQVAGRNLQIDIGSRTVYGDARFLHVGIAWEGPPDGATYKSWDQQTGTYDLRGELITDGEPGRTVEIPPVIIPNHFLRDGANWIIFSPGWQAHPTYTCDISYYEPGSPLAGLGPYATGQGFSGSLTVPQRLTIYEYPYAALGLSPESMGVMPSGSGNMPTDISGAYATTIPLVWQTTYPYVPGTLSVYLDGIPMRKGREFWETDPADGRFTVALAGEYVGTLSVRYARADVKTVPSDTDYWSGANDGSQVEPPSPDGTSGGRVYRPRLVTQMGYGTSLDGMNCVAASACMALDRHTLGQIRSIPPTVRRATGDFVGGLTLVDVAQAIDDLYGVQFYAPGEVSYDTFRAHINTGRGAMLSGDSHVLVDLGYSSSTVEGFHTIYVNEQRENGDYLCYDPAYSSANPKWIPASVVRLYGSRSASIGGRLYRMYATYTRKTGLI